MNRLRLLLKSWQRARLPLRWHAPSAVLRRAQRHWLESGSAPSPLLATPTLLPETDLGLLLDPLPGLSLREPVPRPVAAVPSKRTAEPTPQGPPRPVAQNALSRREEKAGSRKQVHDTRDVPRPVPPCQSLPRPAATDSLFVRLLHRHEAQAGTSPSDRQDKTGPAPPGKNSPKQRIDIPRSHAMASFVHARTSRNTKEYREIIQNALASAAGKTTGNTVPLPGSPARPAPGPAPSGGGPGAGQPESGQRDSAPEIVHRHTPGGSFSAPEVEHPATPAESVPTTSVTRRLHHLLTTLEERTTKTAADREPGFRVQSGTTPLSEADTALCESPLTMQGLHSLLDRQPAHREATGLPQAGSAPATGPDMPGDSPAPALPNVRSPLLRRQEEEALATGMANILRRQARRRGVILE